MDPVRAQLSVLCGSYGSLLKTICSPGLLLTCKGRAQVWSVSGVMDERFETPANTSVCRERRIMLLGLGHMHPKVKMYAGWHCRVPAWKGLERRLKQYGPPHPGRSARMMLSK
jgi:hypothetical protein